MGKVSDFVKLLEGSITVDKKGRRFYLRGNTYPIKDSLRSSGAKWDADERAWWTSKQEVADKFAKAEDVKQDRNDSNEGENLRVIGRANYKGKSYYVVWQGMTRAGFEGWKLAFSDGTKTFWTKQGEQPPTWVKSYDKPKTIRELREYAARAAKTKSQYGGSECANCGSTRVVGEGADSSGGFGPLCSTCLREPAYSRSFG